MKWSFMDGILISNNELARESLAPHMEVVFCDGSYMDVLTAVRDRIHKGHKLLTHPLSGSVKPNENPYKSVIISRGKGKMDTESLAIIESCIETARKFVTKYGCLTQDMRKDFGMIDLSLIKSALS